MSSSGVTEVLLSFSSNDSEATVAAALRSTMNFLSGPSALSVLLDAARTTVFTTMNTQYRGKNPTAVVLTDGLNGEPAGDLSAAVTRLVAAGVRVVALGVPVRGDVGMRVLNTLVSNDASAVFVAGDATDADAVAVSGALASAIACPAAAGGAVPLLCLAGTLGCSCGTACRVCAVQDATQTCVQCRSSTALYNGACVGTCPAGFTVSPSNATGNVCVSQCAELDVAVVIDASGSIPPALFDAMKTFAAAFVAQLPVGTADTR